MQKKSKIETRNSRIETWESESRISEIETQNMRRKNRVLTGNSGIENRY